jgi:hypothetical protein
LYVTQHAGTEIGGNVKLYYNTSNDYLRNIYFDSLLAYRKDIKRIDYLDGIKKDTIIIDAEHLTPYVINELKDNGNRIAAMDINDNSTFCYSYSESPRILDVDVIFKIAGIQKENESFDTVITNDLRFGLKKKTFMSYMNWKYYSIMKGQNRIHSLPYVLWENYNVPNPPWDQRHNKVLVRGGHHYMRVLLLFNLVKHGLVDSNSLFNTMGYVGQYCDGCKSIFNHGRMSLDTVHQQDLPCKLPYKLPDNYFQDRGDWNNACPSRYFEIAEMMDLDRGIVENILNGSYVGITDYYDILNKYTMYADLKWIFSIYAPPRFWEAAAAHTINLVGRRMMDQDYFPELVENEHYITFQEDFIGLKQSCFLLEPDFKRIIDNTYDLYDKWIKVWEYRLSTNLMDHIMQIIEEANG